MLRSAEDGDDGGGKLIESSAEMMCFDALRCWFAIAFWIDNKMWNKMNTVCIKKWKEQADYLIDFRQKKFWLSLNQISDKSCWRLAKFGFVYLWTNESEIAMNKLNIYREMIVMPVTILQFKKKLNIYF